MRHPDVVVIPQDPTDTRLQGNEWNADHIYVAVNADPADPAVGTGIPWMSDGTESGENGDILVKINIGGQIFETKQSTLTSISPYFARIFSDDFDYSWLGRSVAEIHFYKGKISSTIRSGCHKKPQWFANRYSHSQQLILLKKIMSIN